MKNKFFQKSAIIISTSIFLSNFSMLAGAISESATESVTSHKVYEYVTDEQYDANGDLLYNGYLNVAGLNITIEPGHSLETFENSMINLNAQLNDTKTGASSTQVSFDEDNKNDQTEHTLNVQVDFAGKVLAQPLNVMFVMDQSGSLNMYTQTGSITAPAPDMNPDHYYKTKVTLTLEGEASTYVYDYYHNPQLSGATGAWYLSENITITSNYAAYGIEENDLVLPGLLNMYISTSTGDIVIEAPEGVNDYKKIISVKVATINSSTPIFISTEALGPLDCTFPSGTDTNTEDFPFKQYTPSIEKEADWQFYSPELFTRENFYSSKGSYNNFDSEVYISEMQFYGRAYDRMLLSKILFKDLSNIIVANNAYLPTEEQNKMGYVQFAGLVDTKGSLDSANGINERDYYVAGNRGLETSYFDDTFTRTQGFFLTNYYEGFEKAANFFKEEADSASSSISTRDAKNLVIFVSDGAPSDPEGYTDASSFRKIYMNDFVSNTDSIVYFAGIDLSEEIYKEWSAAIATINPLSTSEDDKYLSANGSTLTELIDIRNQIEKLVNSASYLTADIDPLFKLRVDENHPIELTYATTSEDPIEGAVISEPKTITISDMPTPGLEQVFKDTNGVEIGKILYDEAHKTLTWEITYSNVVNARLSFYEKLDESKIDWTHIAKGNTQSAEVLTASTIDFIDENGFNRTLLMDKQGVANINGNSQLRIENVSTPVSGSEVANNSTIDYMITVTNKSITTDSPVDAENVLVVQEIPENTTYVSHTVATISGLGGSRFIQGNYDTDSNEIRFDIPTLKADETLTFNYQVEVTNEYDKTIISVSQLGISNNPDTLDEDGYPFLHSLELVHTTPAPTTETALPPISPTTSSSNVQTPPLPTPTTETTLPPISTTMPSSSVETSLSSSNEPTPESSTILLPSENSGINDGGIEAGKVELTENDYSIGDDGTITINPDFIATLPDGEHVISVIDVYGDIYESVIIVEGGVPLSSTPFVYVGNHGAAWSLFDLMSTIFVAFTVIYISFLKNRKKTDKKEENWDQFDQEYNEIEDTRFAKLRKRKAIVLAVEAIMAIILLLITQDFTQPMIIFDQYSIVFALSVILSIVIVIIANKEPINDEEEISISQKIVEYKEELEMDKEKLLRGKISAIIIDVLLIIVLFIITHSMLDLRFILVFVLCAILIVAIILITNKIEDDNNSEENTDFR